jgi:hypothetical protein
MKFGKKGSIGIIIGGVLAVFSSIDSIADFVIPGQIKLFGGIALIVFGLTQLLFVYENKEEQIKNRKAAFLIVSILTISALGYFYFQEPEKKEYVKTFGTFEVSLNNKKCSGEAILQEGDKVTFQIKHIPTNIKIDGLKLYSRNVEIDTKSIDWVCALMSDLRVIRCSTGLDLPKNNFEMFVDKDAYTISYWLKEPLENIAIRDISFTIINGNEEHNRIEIREKK